MDDKVIIAGDIGTLQPQLGNATMYLASDATTPPNVLSFVGEQLPSDSPNQSLFAINQTRGELFTTRLSSPPTPPRESPRSCTVGRSRGYPGVSAGTTISVVLRMWTVEDVQGQDYYFDPYYEYAFMENLRQTQTLFQYVEGPFSATCTVDEIDWLPEKDRDAMVAGGFQGNFILYFKTWNSNPSHESPGHVHAHL